MALLATMMNVVAGLAMAEPSELGGFAGPAEQRPGATVVLQGVTVALRSARKAPPVAVLNDLTFSVPANQTVALHGPAGSGKSTVLNLIAAHDRPSEGSVFIDSARVDTLSRRDVARMRRRIGTVSHDSQLMAALTVVDNVVFPLLYQRVRFDKHARAHELLDRVGLSGRDDARVASLSPVDRQRVVIARAFANHPALLLADEPTAGLDPTAAREVLDLLVRLTKTHRTTMVLATRDDTVAVESSVSETVD
jgi:putative ABC transport system ATP-binding protein